MSKSLGNVEFDEAVLLSHEIHLFPFSPSCSRYQNVCDLMRQRRKAAGEEGRQKMDNPGANHGTEAPATLREIKGFRVESGICFGRLEGPGAARRRSITMTSFREPVASY